MRREEYAGRFIVVEGADGAGTTTQSRRLADRLDAYWTNEPAGNAVGRKVDEMISDGGYSASAVALAFAADRMIHLEEEVIPRLEQGETVVCDRYYHSSLVYQGSMGLDVEWVRELNRYAVIPDVTFVIDVSAEVGMSRVEARGRDDNIFENLDFQQEVVLRYRRLVDVLDEDVVLVEGDVPKDEVFEGIVAGLRERGFVE